MRKNRIVYLSLLIFFCVYTIIRHHFFTTIIFYTLLMLPIVSLAHILFTYLNFRFIHEVNDRIIVKGDVVQYVCHIHNSNKFFVYCPMSVRFAHEQLFFKEERQEAFFTLFPGQVKTIELPIVCQYRGSYNIGVNALYIMDFFGLIKVKYSFIETIKLLVYPNVERLAYFPIKPVVFENNLSLERSLIQDKSNLFQVRDYAPGDSLNQIHWKMTAKFGELKSKHFSSSLQKKSILFLDNQKLPFDAETNIIIEDLLVEAIVAISQFLLFRQIPVQLFYHDKDLSIYEGQNHHDWDSLYELLAKLQFVSQVNLESMISDFIQLSRVQVDQQGANIIVATHKITDKILAQLITLKLQGFEVILLMALTQELLEKEEILKQLENERIKVYTLKQGQSLQSIIEGDYYVS